MIGKSFGHYRVVRELGKGGMGEVFLATDTILERQVALKFVATQAQTSVTTAQQLQREAKTAAALDHPYICKIYEIGEDHGRVFIAMEYVEGSTFEEKLNSGTLEFSKALQLAAETAEAIGE